MILVYHYFECLQCENSAFWKILPLFLHSHSQGFQYEPKEPGLLLECEHGGNIESEHGGTIESEHGGNILPHHKMSLARLIWQV